MSPALTCSVPLLHSLHYLPKTCIGGFTICFAALNKINVKTNLVLTKFDWLIDLFIHLFATCTSHNTAVNIIAFTQGNYSFHIVKIGAEARVIHYWVPPLWKIFQLSVHYFNNQQRPSGKVRQCIRSIRPFPHEFQQVQWSINEFAIGHWFGCYDMELGLDIGDTDVWLIDWFIH